MWVAAENGDWAAVQVFLAQDSALLHCRGPVRCRTARACPNSGMLCVRRICPALLKSAESEDGPPPSRRNDVCELSGGGPSSVYGAGAAHSPTAPPWLPARAWADWGDGIG